jgi:flagellar hook-associated protein 1 FlgK
MLSIGVSGLNAAQAGLATVSNNIANAATPGYTRQLLNQVENVSLGSNGFNGGTGVNVVSVQRAYSQFLTSAVWSANTGQQGATTFSGLTTTLNSLLTNSGLFSTDPSGNTTGPLDNFFDGFGTIAGNGPTVGANRLQLLSNATSLANVFNTLAQQLSQQQGQVNGQIGATVTSINQLSSQIADLNDQIRQAGGVSGGLNGPPNALLDQRDLAVQQLAGLTSVSPVVESDGSISVFTSTGQSLVNGTQSSPLSTQPDQFDPTKLDVVDSNGNNVTSSLTGGTLGALINYRDNVLASSQNQLGQSAAALAISVNAQQAQGLDNNGKQGQPIFSIAAPTVLASGNNTGSATVSATISDVSQLTSSDFVLKFTGAGTGTNGFTLTTTGGQSVPLTANPDGSLSAQGVTINVAGAAPQVGDSFEIQPTRNAATTLAVSLTDPNGLAAVAALSASAATANKGSGQVGAVSVTDSSNPNLLAGATIAFTGPNTYTLTDSTGAHTGLTYTPGQPITSGDGFSLSLSGAPATGDTFTVAANTGLNGNSNALALQNLSNAGVLNGGQTSVIASIGNLTTQIGTVGDQADSNVTIQTNLFNQAVSSQQSVSGVNTNEEGANLIMYQQAFQASAQVISTAQAIFASLITALQA